MTTFLTILAILLIVGALYLFLLDFTDRAVTVADRIIMVGYRVAEMKEDLEDRRDKRESRNA